MSTEQNYPAAFKLIEKAGGSKLPNKSVLTFNEKLQIWKGNGWVLIFAPFYYSKHKILKKSFAYLPVGLVMYVLLASIFPVPKEKQVVFFVFSWNFICFLRANIDLYKKEIEKNNGWWG